MCFSGKFLISWCFPEDAWFVNQDFERGTMAFSSISRLLPLAVVSQIFFVPLFTEVATISDFFYAMTPHGKRTLILATMLYLHSGKFGSLSVFQNKLCEDGR